MVLDSGAMPYSELQFNYNGLINLYEETGDEAKMMEYEEKYEEWEKLQEEKKNKDKENEKEEEDKKMDFKEMVEFVKNT